jgi:hypothetical protein
VTNAYVDLVVGQRQAAKAERKNTNPIGGHADGPTGKKSAKTMPSPAAKARPTNGWRDAAGIFARQRLGLLVVRFGIRRHILDRA